MRVGSGRVGPVSAAESDGMAALRHPHEVRPALRACGRTDKSENKKKKKVHKPQKREKDGIGQRALGALHHVATEGRRALILPWTNALTCTMIRFRKRSERSQHCQLTYRQLPFGICHARIPTLRCNTTSSGLRTTRRQLASGPATQSTMSFLSTFGSTAEYVLQMRESSFYAYRFESKYHVGTMTQPRCGLARRATASRSLLHSSWSHGRTQNCEEEIRSLRKSRIR